MPLIAATTAIAIAAAGFAQIPDALVGAVSIASLDPGASRITIRRPPNARDPATDVQLLVAADMLPLGWFAQDSPAQDPSSFRAVGAVNWPAADSTLAAWLISRSVVAAAHPRWPADSEFFAEIECVGPGRQSAWVRRGSNDGIRPGDCWWLRIGGQPAARFDVRLVEPEMCFCRAVPLVADAPIAPGQRITLWPSPGLRQQGAARSAICFVEQAAQPRVWVPWPSNVLCPPEPHIEFFRAGRFVGHAVADHRDDRFWYARPFHFASAEALQVGDEARIRTHADIAQRRFVAWVFETGPEGALITAGEDDGLLREQPCEVYRAGQPVAAAVVGKVQREYALVDCAAELQVFDEVRFGPAPGPPRDVGTVDALINETLIRVRLRPGGDAPIGAPLAVRANGRVVAVALLVGRSGDFAAGFLPTAGLAEAVPIGAVLELGE